MSAPLTQLGWTKDIFVDASTATTSEIGTAFETVTQDLQEPLRLSEQRDYSISLVEAVLFYGDSNVKAGSSTLVFENSTGPTLYTITVPEGLYSVQQLSSTVARLLSDQGQGSVSAPLLSLVADQPTQTLGIQFIDQIGWRYRPDLSSDAMGVLLGWPQAGPVPAYNATAPAVIYGSQPGIFQQVTSYRIGCDLVGGSLLSGGGIRGDTLAVVPLSRYTPNTFMDIVPTTIAKARVNRRLIERIIFRLTGQNGVGLRTGEPYSVLIRIEDVGPAGSFR